RKLGARPRQVRGVRGTSFAVWAPTARSVSVVGDFNGWDGRLHQMRSLGASGIWELFLPEIGPGARYKYEVRGADGSLAPKPDPFELAAEEPPAPASVVCEPSPPFQDADWVTRRRSSQPYLGPT